MNISAARASLLAKLFTTTAETLDVETSQRIADALDLRIPEIANLFYEAADAVKASAPLPPAIAAALPSLAAWCKSAPGQDHADGTRRLFDDGRGLTATDGQSSAPATTETAPDHHDAHGELAAAGYPAADRSADADKFYVGRNDNAIPVKDFSTIAEAEAQITKYMETDPKGVDAGEYYIDAPESYT